ncbi:MAG: helix-turn-helix transcriptional regulator [Bacilli bacterium]|nr:helix-turn-helix transcriptional regulator [Bacilli bacterium]MBN2697104.1 helix-turn-helix transcriptional regulator [Bacilli bacterium]
MIQEKDIRDVLAKNLVRYRKANNLTQMQLAEKLNYSDKSISKWERKEGLPDLVILIQIAELFGITVNDLLIDRKRLQRPKHRMSRVLIILIAVTTVWFIATSCFVLLGIFAPLLEKTWLAFIYAIPVSLVVLSFYSRLWANRFYQFLAISLLSWSVPLSLYLSFDLDKLWLLFIAIIPLQILTALYYVLKSRNSALFRTNKQTIE